MTYRLDCAGAREQLSARRDGELADERALLGHLAACAECSAHARFLEELAPAWQELRTAAPPAELWSRIELAARPRAFVRPRLLARVAALLIGFLGLGAGALWLEGRAAPRRAHVLELLAGAAPPADGLAFLNPLPEYRLLRGLPSAEETR